MNLRIITMKRYLRLPRTPELNQPHHRMQFSVILKTGFLRGISLFCGEYSQYIQSLEDRAERKKERERDVLKESLKCVIDCMQTSLE